MKTVAALAVLAVFLTIGSCVEVEGDDGLKCYVYADCQASFVANLTDANTQTCRNGPRSTMKARCVKQISRNGAVTRRCGNEATDCHLGGVIAKCDGDGVKPCRICCDTDKCNSATTFHVSAIVLLVVAAMHKFLF